MNTSDKGGFFVRCPNCGASYLYSPDKIADDGTVQCQNCLVWLSVPSKLEQDRGAVVSISAAKEAAARVRTSRPIRDLHLKRDLPTALYHGLYLSLTVLASFWLWIYVNYSATLLGGLIGSYVGIAVISFGIVEVVGYTNVFLTQNLWDVYCRKDWLSVFSHGAIMSLLLLAALFPATYILPVVSAQSSDIYVPAVAGMIVLYWIAIGLIGRFVAYLFTVDKRKPGKSAPLSD
jgi:predicted Zn finger-like uncharacterized protein